MRLKQVLEERAQELRAWLEKKGHNCWHEQRHLNEDSAEQVYWHFGYLSALQDVLARLPKQVN
jgi:uncharacterized protein YecT (DUF1311 family)